MDQSADTILVVDDEANFREIFSVKLESLGYKVETARNGKEAIEKATMVRPALILMDVQMPEMGGVEAFLRLKENPLFANTPILFLTNLGEPSLELQGADRKYAQEIGAVGYLKKTEDLNVLMGHLAVYLHK